MNTRLTTYNIIILLLSIFTGCTDENIGQEETIAPVSTLQAKDIFYNQATIQGADYTGKASEKGFYFSSEDFVSGRQEADRVPATETEGNIFRAVMTGLEKGTSYYVQAFILNEDGTETLGERVIFRTETMTVNAPSALSGEVSVLDARRATVRVSVASYGDENLTAAEKKLVSVKMAAAGIYYWKDGEDFSTAVKAECNEADANKILPAEIISFEIDGLAPGTDYKYRLFTKTGAYYSQKTAYSEEVISEEEGSFKTEDVVLPTVKTMESSPATTLATLYAQLSDTGNDPETKYGISYGISTEEMGNNMVEAANIDKDGKYSTVIRDLSPLTKYYACAYATNDAGTSYGEAVEFTTLDYGLPIIEDLAMDYEWRLANITPPSEARIKCTVRSDGGKELTAYGIYFGESPENLGNKYESTDYDINSSTFTVPVSSLKAGKPYYYKPFATNEFGEATGKVMTFRMPVYGGKQYEFDNTTTSGMPHTRMKFNKTDLYYWELDPIRMGTDTYYFLDRNLGAIVPFGRDNFATIPENNQESTWSSIGYYYQFNRNVPSATPDINIKTSLTGQYGWTNKETPVGSTWINTICPEGYVIPDRNVFNELIMHASDGSLEGFFEMLRIGITGIRNPGAGQFVPTASDNYSGLWTNDATGDTGNPVSFKVENDEASVVSSYGRYFGLPVRCVRIEPLDTSGDLNPYEPGEEW